MDRRFSSEEVAILFVNVGASISSCLLLGFAFNDWKVGVGMALFGLWVRKP